MSDYFRHARTAEPFAASGSGSLRRRRSARTSAGSAAASASSIRSRRRGSPTPGCGVFQAAVEHKCEVLEDALTVIRQNVTRFAAEDFFPTPESRDELLRFLKPRAGLYARLSEMHDCGLLGQMFPGVPGDFLARGPRLLSQVHRRRAHAADDPESRTAGERLSARAASASRRWFRSSKSRSCWCCRCSSTTSASGRTKITRPKASGWPIT